MKFYFMLWVFLLTGVLIAVSTQTQAQSQTHTQGSNSREEQEDLAPKAVQMGAFVGAMTGDVARGMMGGLVAANILEASGYRLTRNAVLPSIRTVDASGMLVLLPQDLPPSLAGALVSYSDSADLLDIALGAHSEFDAHARYALVEFLTRKGFLSKFASIGTPGSMSELTAHNELLNSSLVQNKIAELEKETSFQKINSYDARIADGLRLVVLQLAFANRLKKLFPEEEGLRFEILDSALGTLMSLENRSRVSVFRIIFREQKLEMRAQLLQLVQQVFHLDLEAMSHRDLKKMSEKEFSEFIQILDQFNLSSKKDCRVYF